MRGKDLVKAENMKGAAILVPADAAVVCCQITAASVNATLNGGRVYGADFQPVDINGYTEHQSRSIQFPCQMCCSV